MKEITPTIYPDTPPPTDETEKHYALIPTVARLKEIARIYAGGLPLRRIARLPGMPTYVQLLEWHHESDFFKNELEAARKTRALDVEEAIREISEEEIHEKEASGRRINYEALKWLAQTSHPEKYGQKTQVTGDKNNPVIFRIETNVPVNDHQRPPELDARGIIQAKEVVSEVVDASPDGPVFSEADHDG